MQVLCKLLFYNLDITGLDDPLYSAVHPMKYLESDVMTSVYTYTHTHTGTDPNRCRNAHSVRVPPFHYWPARARGAQSHGGV